MPWVNANRHVDVRHVDPQGAHGAFVVLQLQEQFGPLCDQSPHRIVVTHADQTRPRSGRLAGANSN
jgi:hypothetical protein